MKRWLFLCVCLWANQGFAVSASFVVQGTLVLSPCVLPPEASQIEVDMGNWSQETFAVSETGPAVPFVIHLEECYPEVASTAEVSFNGQSTVENTDVLSLDTSSTATGIGIAISGQDGRTITLNRGVYAWRLASGVNDIPLQAQVIVVSDTVQPGTYSATVNFTLSYP
ncbi:hypothetical protein CHU32_02965 [Superficieibacter electus]|uniref:Fimbrial-type adhesion domain-containing protein n=1 Tax=Superficieibacter electus TaxID=2022662 RepID=A0A2P5GV23_9ENTR|nr:fimbrial protein [Superficieibacter electus]POP44384.1 hypothetical protein CHU33_13075 [Superficieibacter electus]POP50402.1 hypothetical protein CHU32_02965 [Superficieibacter electus]